MIAWHYTSHSNWVKIRREGLVPLLVDHPDVLALGVGPVFGTWAWPNPQEGQAHLGNVLFQLASKGDPRVVKLAVDYEEADEWTNRWGDLLRLRHHGFQMTYTRGKASGPERPGPKYHDGEQSLILGRRIRPGRLRLVGDYDLVGLLSTSSTSAARRSGRRTVFGGARTSTTASGTRAPARRSSRATSPSSPTAP